jgi:toxin FitB
VVRVLLDTCVISELRRPQGDHRVSQRVAELEPGSLFLSAITLGELTKGIALLPEGRRKRELASWLLGIERQFTEQILPVDHDVARLRGELTAHAQLQGIQIPASDGLIAATAIRHGLHVMTHNTKHFAASGALILDPWQD